MKIAKVLRNANSGVRWVALVVSLMGAATAQAGDVEVTALGVGRFWGSFKVQQEGYPNGVANMGNSGGYGASAGYRFDAEDCEKCNFVGFRWMKQNTHLSSDASSPGTAFSVPVRLDHFIGDFRREWPIQETHGIISPFLNLSLGAIRMSTPIESRTRFEFGIGTGVNVLLKEHWGFRAQVEYLPMVKYAEVQRIVCVGGCVVTLYGGVMDQLVVSFGPTFRF